VTHTGPEGRLAPPVGIAILRLLVVFAAADLPDGDFAAAALPEGDFGASSAPTAAALPDFARAGRGPDLPLVAGVFPEAPFASGLRPLGVAM
jgi:hypothetical protein